MKPEYKDLYFAVDILKCIFLKDILVFAAHLNLISDNNSALVHGLALSRRRAITWNNGHPFHIYGSIIDIGAWPGARPTNNISIEFEIRPKLTVLWF